MAEAFLQVLLENLSSLIQREIGLIMGVDKEMKKLSSTLTTIQTVLEDAEDKQFQSRQIQNWLIKLNDIAYEVDDILSECAAGVLKLERNGIIFRLIKKILFSRKIGRRMKEMAERLDAVAAERHNFHLREMVLPQVDARRETGPVVSEPDHIYGRDGDRDKIVYILVNQVRDCQQLSVLPIVGVGGLGKTTLAQLVYNDQRVSQHFDAKLWVCVSDKFDLKILLEAMIASATGSATGSVPLDVLERRIREVLSQKRYLLILDDVWNDNQESWFLFKSILACGSKGASVVVTTRLKKVAEIMGTLPAHCLKGLSEEHCWLLFRLRAFGMDNEEQPNLETIGRQIVHKCSGVPLAAKALGGLLRFERKEKEWIHVKESEIWNLAERETLILPALRLSYHHLPLVLRWCFAYCAVFPKDYTMEKQDLIFRWMAHGCISSNGIQEVEDVGDQVWNELVWRSFFQEVKTTGSETTFKMHDLVHDLAQSIMENRVPGAQMKSNSAGASCSKIREVYMSQHSMISSSSITVQVSAITTITNYNRLRILKLIGQETEKLPSAIGKLKRLRFIHLHNCSIRALPDTFCDLWNLQILTLNYCYYLRSLPKRIRYMINLRHISLEECGLSHMPPRIGELTSLRTLSLFIVGHKTGHQLDELEHLNLGGKLEIKHLERVENPLTAKKASLAEKPNLRDLVLCWEGDSTSSSGSAKVMDDKVVEALEPHPNLETLVIIGFRGCYMPLWMTKMENVTKITLATCSNCSHLPPLGDLPRLKSLHLKDLVGLEYIEEDEIQGRSSARPKFPSLEEVTLECLPNLQGLLKEQEVGEMFPNLISLYIRDCQMLTLPPLSTLEKLEARFCSLLNLSSFSYKLENLTSLVVLFSENTRACIREETLPEGPCNLKELRVSNAQEDFLLEKWFQGLKSLTVLHIHSCKRMSCFPGGWLRHLTALEGLSIHNCSDLVELPEEIKHLRLLKHLQLDLLDNMASLPQGLLHIPSLQSLAICELPQLASLPDWLGSLASLTSLGIAGCLKVPSLPSSIQGMTSLRRLSIWNCPQLERRCEKDKGEDWHKIAHIPQLHISK